MQIESKIRDWLAGNLNFIESGLQLIGKEYHLPSTVGSKGFIDLLCSDIYNNYVIIEIKRSDISSRQTITEVLKYYSLIKHNFGARESEIRIIIISTHWDELIRAFSEICHKSNIAVKGYRIEVDSSKNIPHSITIVEPLKLSTIARKFAFWQGFYLFRTTEKRELFHTELNKRLSAVSIHDYVLLDIDAPKENIKIVTPYAIAAAFQKLPSEELLEIIKALNNAGKTDVMNRDDFEEEVFYQRHLEGAFIDSLAMYEYDDDAEAGYAEKLDSILNAQGWTIHKIHRKGIFRKDPRYTDHLLLKEVRGHDGNSKNKFTGIAESTQPERIKEIHKECMHSLAHTPQWAEFIDCLFYEIEQKNEKTRILVDIYNPDSLITSLYFTLTKANPDYLPLYTIFVDYIDYPRTEVFIGELYWDKQFSPNASLLISTNGNEIANEVFRLNIDPDNLLDSLKMALFYTNKKIVVENNKEIANGFATVEDNIIVADNTVYDSIQEYIIYYQQDLMRMIANYNSVYSSM